MLETTKTKRNQLFAELHTLLAQRLGPDPGAIGIRYGQLLGLVQEISVCESLNIFSIELFNHFRVLPGKWTRP
jgi:tetrahydromethanopterin S-methyltransferase subunit G